MMRRGVHGSVLAAMLAAAVGCGDAGTATGETSAGETGGVDLCAAGEVVCGVHASCDPLDGACYCAPGYLGDPAAGCACVRTSTGAKARSASTVTPPARSTMIVPDSNAITVDSSPIVQGPPSRI